MKSTTDALRGKIYLPARSLHIFINPAVFNSSDAAALKSTVVTLAGPNRTPLVDIVSFIN